MKLISSASVLFFFIGHVFGQLEDFESQSPEKFSDVTEDDIFKCYKAMHCELGKKIIPWLVI